MLSNLILTGCCWYMRMRRLTSKRLGCGRRAATLGRLNTDFFVVPTATFRWLFVFVVLCHDRRRIVHFAVTSHPTAEWTAQQLLQAFPWDTAPRFLLRDRDRNCGKVFRQTA